MDTPGTGAVVAEHQTRTAEYMQLYGQLRERHNRETQEVGDKSDAIICLIGAVARASDRDFLQEFAQATGGKSRALNAIGVMAKIDLSQDVMSRREALCAKVAKHGEQFQEDELDELRRLLRLYGLDTAERLPPGRAGDGDSVAARQQHWRAVGEEDRRSAKRAVAERAHDRLGLILKELSSPRDREAV